ASRVRVLAAPRLIHRAAHRAGQIEHHVDVEWHVLPFVGDAGAPLRLERGAPVDAAVPVPLPVSVPVPGAPREQVCPFPAAAALVGAILLASAARHRGDEGDSARNQNRVTQHGATRLYFYARPTRLRPPRRAEVEPFNTTPLEIPCNNLRRRGPATKVASLRSRSAPLRQVRPAPLQPPRLEAATQPPTKTGEISIPGTEPPKLTPGRGASPGARPRNALRTALAERRRGSLIR